MQILEKEKKTFTESTNTQTDLNKMSFALRNLVCIFEDTVDILTNKKYTNFISIPNRL